MESFFLPVTVRPDKREYWRIHYAHLTLAENSNDKTERNYIIEYPDSKFQDTFSLFCIRREESYSMISSRAASDNKRLRGLAFSFRYDDTDKTLSVLLSEQQEADQLGPDLLLESSANAVTVCHRKNSGFRGLLHVHLIYRAGDKSFTDTFTITLIDRKYLYYAALDFGSEASQLKYLKATRDSPYRNRKIDIINRLKNELRSSDTVFWQDDSSGHKDLYRSVFTINETLENNYETCDRPLSICDLHKDIHLLESKMVSNINGKLLPNLKLFKLLQDDVTSYEIRDNIFHIHNETRLDLIDIYDSIRQQIIYSLIQVLLKDLLEEVQPNEKKAVGIILRLLAPNIYSHKDVFEMVNRVYRHFDELKRKVLPMDSPIYLFAEISVIAESEAAIIKEIKLDRDNLFANKTVLTIDGGKGTMDIGVCFVKDKAGQKHIFSLYRSGFAGAGDLISHGYFDYFINRVNQALEKQSLMTEIDRLIDRILSSYPNISALKDLFDKRIKNQTSERAKILAVKTFISMIPVEDENRHLLNTGCDTWLGKSVDKNLVKERIRQLNYQQKLHLMNFFDEMKKNSCTANESINILDNAFYLDVFKKLKNEQFDEFIDLLQRNSKDCMMLCDSYNGLPGEIKIRIDSIIDAIIEKLTSVRFFNPKEPDNAIDVAFYSGRCFLFRPLAEQLEKRIKEKIAEFERDCESEKQKDRFRIFKSLWGKANQLAGNEEEQKKEDFNFSPISTELDPNFLKYASIIGAIIKDAGINNGSELSGILFSDSIIRDIRHNPEQYESRLFFEGHPVFHDGTPHNSTAIRFNGYQMPGDFHRDSEATGYFVGEGFLIQYRDESNRQKAEFIKWDFWLNDNNDKKKKLHKMLNDSFFPFNI